MCLIQLARTWAVVLVLIILHSCLRWRPRNSRLATRHGFAEILGFRYGLKLGIGNLKFMASNVVFVRVIFDLKRSSSSNARN
jgi:hypothetical protein